MILLMMMIIFPLTPISIVANRRGLDSYNFVHDTNNFTPPTDIPYKFEPQLF